MLNSESEKRSNERLKTLHNRKRKYERLLSNPIKQKERDDSENTQQEKYRTLIENIPCAIYSAYPGKAGPTTFMSKKWEDWTGYSSDELYRDPEAWPKCIHPDDKEKTVNTYLRACQDNIPYNLEYRIVHKETGQVRYVCDQGHLSNDKNSNVIRVDGIITDVTEIKWMEKSLRESEERFRRIFEEGPIGIATSGEDFRFIRANAAFCEMMGRKESELRELTFRDITYPEDLYRDVEPIQRLLRGEIPIYRTEKRYVRKGTEIVWGYMTATAVRNEAGLFQCFLIMVEDITERKCAEEALRESEGKFRSLADQSPNMIFINKKGKVVYANKKCEEVVGHTREKLCSPDFDFRTLIAPESLCAVSDNFARHLRGEDVQPYDYTIINKDGKRVEVIYASKLIQYEGGTAILGIVTDITERKKAEQALRESEERLKILFESAPDAIYLADSEGRFVDGNRAAENLIGYEREDVIGKKVADVDLLSAEQLLRAQANLQKVIAGELSGPNEYTVKRKNGTYVSIEVRNFPVKIRGKMLSLGIARDITEHKRTEKELLEHQAKLKSLASQLSLIEERERYRLATDLHDQISQSLVISKIKLDQLRKSSNSDEFREPLEDISNCLGQIIGDTRALTFDLSYPILYELGFEAAVAEWLTDQIQEEHGIRTEFVDDGRQKPLDDDIRVLLFRNVRELLINVIKHAEANRVKVTIRRDNKYINVVVEDDGVGFDPVEVTSMASKRAEFGLFSIRERLEQLGGMIEIDSKPGFGSKITMRAPLKYDNSTDRIDK